MKFYDQETKRKISIYASSVAGYCGGVEAMIQSVTHFSMSSSPSSDVDRQEEVCRRRAHDSLKSIMDRPTATPCNDRDLFSRVYKALLSKEEREHYNKLYGRYNARIGNTLHLIGYARAAGQGQSLVPTPRHWSEFRQVLSCGYRKNFAPTRCESHQLAGMYAVPAPSTVVHHALIDKEEVTSCYAVHISRDSRGGFNMAVYDRIKEQANELGLVDSWVPLGKRSVYACMPVPLFSNTLHGRGYSWVSFFYRTTDPDTLPPIQIGTIEELLA